MVKDRYLASMFSGSTEEEVLGTAEERKKVRDFVDRMFPKGNARFVNGDLVIIV